MWHGPEAAGGGPLLRLEAEAASVSCVGCGTLPLDKGLKMKYDTKLNSSFTGKSLSLVSNC